MALMLMPKFFERYLTELTQEQYDEVCEWLETAPPGDVVCQILEVSGERKETK